MAARKNAGLAKFSSDLSDPPASGSAIFSAPYDPRAVKFTDESARALIRPKSPSQDPVGIDTMAVGLHSETGDALV